MSELGLVHSSVMLQANTPFYNALAVLYRNRVSGLALIDLQGTIVGNLSASDLRGMTEKSFEHFRSPTLEYLQRESPVSTITTFPS